MTAAGRMTPADRESLIGMAKRAATPVASCVAARVAPAHIIGDMTRAELKALVIVLAEAVDHALLRTVVETGDGGAAGGGGPGEPARLRAAHAEAGRLRRDGMVVPTSIRILDNAYHEALRAARAAAAAPPRGRTARKAAGGVPDMERGAA